jgi:hypothetical protein
MSSCGGGPNTGNPTPVTIMKPETKPELNLNGFLLSNGAILGCKEVLTAVPFTYPSGWVDAPQMKAAPGGMTVQEEHNEPPIGGEDGSFRLYMNVMDYLSGTTSTRKKLCANPEHGHGYWTLHWRRWDGSGNVIAPDANASPNPVDGIKIKLGDKVRVSFSGSQDTVEIVREGDVNGSAWASSTTGKFGAKTYGGQMSAANIGVNTYFDLDVANASAIRMAKIEVINGATTTTIPLLDKKAENSCAAFVICHDGLRCNIPVPAKCVKGTNPTKGDDKPHVH